MYDKSAQIQDWQTICHRAGGRRHYNAHRQFLAMLRRAQVVGLLQEEGLGWGFQTRVARQRGVSPS
ncbi:MAG: hypothetical protein ACYC3X_07825, partial [Pirellulaceae bacterium]